MRQPLMSEILATSHLAGLAQGLSATQPASAAEGPVQAGWGLALGDLSRFEQAMGSAVHRLDTVSSATGPAPVAKALMEPLERINQEAQTLATMAREAEAAGRTMSPSEVLQLTVRSQEFMFHTQLTANAANRTSDGLQQLFRQQS